MNYNNYFHLPIYLSSCYFQGFSNYCGFMHVECAHTHPVMITFLRLLMIDAEKSKSEGLEMHQIVIDINDTENQQKPSISKSRARARWLLLYTLHNNPTIRVYRKRYLDYVKSMQERLTRNYKLNTTAMGNLVKNVNNVFINNDKDDIADTDETTNAHDNWNALFAMHKFLQQIQKDVAKKKIPAKVCDEESVQMNNRNTKHDDKVNDVKDDNLSSDTSDVASGTSKQFSTDKNVHTKSTKNLWKRGAFLSLANKDTVHPTSEL
ncbi:uncharacterized protein LOC128558630 [Mercenaria mercenaria]|uniref:uncharacterized protein LOC128558630 n=1 Tax=Mercenaria mercenaria TaxID=6596 RepID=UPI00234F42EC|nr:uncharacterized protein LOC128558630 [Mercenaria mercenaria]